MAYRVLLLFSSALIWRCSLATFEPPYLRICGNNQEYSLDSNECEKGVWLRRPFSSSCVCARGVWALTSDFCDDNAAIIVGDGHCFQTPFRIRAAKLIGDPKDPFQPKVYVTPRTLDVVNEVKEDGYSPPIQTSDSIFVIGINPRQVAQRRDYSTCVDLNPDDYSKPVHIYVTSRRSMTQWRLDPKRQFSCPSLKEYQYHLAYGEIFMNGRVQKKSSGVDDQCESECSSEQKRVQKEDQGDNGDWDASQTKSYATTNTTRPISNNRKTLRALKTMEERYRELEELRAQVQEAENSYKKEVNEQTLRMMHAHISSLLLNIQSAQVITREYRYFQQIRKVVEKTCPEEYVPKQVLKGLMRMFRQLLWETHDTFQHVESGDEEQFHRTLERLQECNEKTSDPSVLFATFTESWKRPNVTDGAAGGGAGAGAAGDNSTNSTGPAPAPTSTVTEPPPERCPVPLIFAVNGTYYNRTFTNDKENEYIRNLTHNFQPHLKFNATQVDFVIESAWKIAMIGHYRCSKFFDDQTAIEFSHFFHQVQSFFNPRIVKRWYYKNSVDATFSIVQMIFPSFDLKKFMFGLDACLYGTQGFSFFDYNNLWLQRPKIPYTDNDLSQKKNVLPGSGSPLSTLDYSPDRAAPSPTGGKANETSPTKTPTKAPPGGQKKGRKKRDAGGGSGFNLWNERARCLQSYTDPIDDKDFEYRLPEGCISPVFDLSNQI